MMKKLVLLLFLFPAMALAQKVIKHTVAAKESLSSIGRKYDINPKELAEYNHIDYSKPLSIGQILKVPVKNSEATKLAATKEPAKPEKEVADPEEFDSKTTIATPLYHTVESKETLYSISKLFDGVPIAKIKKWNNLNSDEVKEGEQLIIGYRYTKKSDVGNNSVAASPIAATPVKPATEKKESVVTPSATKIEPEIQNGKVGYFRSLYDSQTKGKSLQSLNGVAGIFKSTSGWEDGKYYCLHNNIPAGTVVKVTSTLTGKFIYAKVLDVIPDLRENGGVVIRLSNAAAGALGIAENTFDCTINYAL